MTTSTSEARIRSTEVALGDRVGIDVVVGQALQHGRDHLRERDAREVRPRAAVDADSERHVPVGVPVDHERVGIGEFRVVPTGGHLVSAYALGVVVGAPVLASAGAKFPRRTMLVWLMVAYALANVLSALAPSYGLLQWKREPDVTWRTAFPYDLTPDELRGLMAELNDVVTKWGAPGKRDGSLRPDEVEDDGRESVFIFTHAFPEKG